MTDKPNLTRVWAGTAPGGNVVDPDTVTAGKFAAGWQAEVPPFEYFNFIQKQITEGLAHINEQGIAVWDDITNYPVGALAKGSDGNIYKALVSQNDNDPVSTSGFWGDYIPVGLAPEEIPTNEDPASIEKRITNNASGGGALTSITLAFDDNTIVCMYRGGSTIHSIEEGAHPVITKSVDSGRTWSTPVTIIQDPSYDLRNYGGGIAPNGDLILFYCRRSTGGTDQAGYVVSSDKGDTWGSENLLAGASSVPTVHSPFANFGDTLVQPFLADTPDRGLWLARSIDNGATWSVEEIFTEADAQAVVTDGTLNESFIIAFDDNRGFIISRAQGGESTGAMNPLCSYTTDGGATWNPLQESNVPSGSQPPTLYYDGYFLWYLWPNRKTFIVGDTGKYTPEIKGSSTAGAHTYTRQAGSWVSNNNMITVYAAIDVDVWDSSASGNLEITLPSGFTPDVAFEDTAAGASYRRLSLDTGDSGFPILGVFSGQGVLSFRVSDLTGKDSTIESGDVNAASQPSFHFSITYPIEKRLGTESLGANYQAALLHVDNIASPDKFRPVFALPFALPLHSGSVKGDSGYGNVLLVEGSPYLFYYKGSFDTYGCDVYMGKMPVRA